MPGVTHNIRMLAVDLDGTTVGHDGEISPRVLAALMRAAQRGVRVVIATGRTPSGLRRFAQRMNLGGPAITTQGGLVVDMDTGEELHRLYMPRALAREVLSHKNDWPALCTVLYRSDHLFVDDLATFNAHADLVGVTAVQVEDLRSAVAEHDPDKILFLTRIERTREAFDAIRAFVGARATVVQSHARIVEVNPLGADKGSALAWLAAHFGIPREEVMAIGDQHNDVTMLRWAGLGVAMGNASPEIQAVADVVTSTIDEDGAAEAIEKYVF
jgi:Cof subfamily protein (haloacid dehalogenase superfamily)